MRKFLLLLMFLGSLLFFKTALFAQNCSSKEDCERLISETEQKLAETRNQKNTLSSQITFMDTQIYLTTLRIQDTQNQIAATEAEIETLGERIEGIDTSLNYLTKLLLEKIAESYKRREIPFVTIFIDSENANIFANRLKYAKITQANDQRVAFQLQQAKLNFEEQKDTREKKVAELDQLKANLDAQNADLANQKASKQQLLAVTQNDERNYQSLLSRLRAEYLAIQGIIAGAGTEEQIREVKKGDVIAAVIPSASCNSSGEHLHFTVLEGGGVNNPFNYLRDIDHVDRTGGDSWSPSGSWDWPLSPTIEFNQGYGVTKCSTPPGWCSSIYSSHNGIDISSPSLSVYAVSDGTLFRGTYSVGCALPYARVKHKDSNLETLYLHTYVN